jgi:HSP20 family molecular chaperone IbpA
LPSGIGLDRTGARFDNGVPTLRVPKAGTRQTAKQIDIG